MANGKPGTLSTEDLKRIGATFLYALGGFVVTWLISTAVPQYVQDPTLQMALVGFITVIAKALHLTSTDTTQTSR